MPLSDTCASIRDKLVDYADGELTPVATQRVAEHLSVCGACRQELAALGRSLKVARSVWRSSVETYESRPTVAWQTREGVVRGRRVRQARLIALAASLLVAVAASGWWWRTNEPEVDVAQAPSVDEAPVAEPHSNSPSEGKHIEGSDIEVADIEVAEIERMLDREELAARLAASAQVLADQPGAEEYAQRSFRYLAEVFPNTAAGKEAARKVIQ